MPAVPDKKTVKNRVHLADGVEWDVLAGREGDEFRVSTPR